MLPPLQSGWLDPILVASVPEETEATCDCCVMQAAPGAAPTRGDVCFAAAKCCTYHPRLDNFLAGRVLADGSEEARAGRLALERGIAAGIGVTPLNVGGSPAYWLMYRNASDAFGRSRALRCPYYDAKSGRCGVWRHRDCICATWYCKYERGAIGSRFWNALRMLLRRLESAVALHCATALDLGDDALALALADDGSAGPTGAELDGAADADSNRKAWGRWYGREQEFYRKSMEIAEALAPAEVLALGGAEAVGLARIARRRLAEVRSSDLPDGPLRLGNFEVIRSDGAAARVCTYSSYDPLDVPSPVLAALLRFDGRPTCEVVREIAERDRLAVPPAMLRTLLDHELLVPVSDR